MSEDDKWKDIIPRQNPRPWLPTMRKRPSPTDDLSDILKEMKKECTGCWALIRVLDNYKFCPYCGCLLRDTIDLEQIKELLVIINAKIGRYLDQKRKEDERARDKDKV